MISYRGSGTIDNDIIGSISQTQRKESSSNHKEDLCFHHLLFGTFVCESTLGGSIAIARYQKGYNLRVFHLFHSHHCVQHMAYL